MVFRFFVRFVVLFPLFVTGQRGGPWNVDSNGVINGSYIKEHILTRSFVPSAPVREADVIWSKRIWRQIDLREKLNYSLYLPMDEHTPSGEYMRNSSHWSLWTVLRQHILDGDLTVFSTYNPYQESILDGDQFKYPIQPEKGKTIETDSLFREKMFYYLGSLGPQSDIPIANQFGEDSIVIGLNGQFQYVYAPADTIWIDSKDIISYHLKEDWFFDKERSIMDVRIIGIAPVVYSIQQDPNGNSLISGTKELFWLYFPSCRKVLCNYAVFNPHNDAQELSFDDLFCKRIFTSVIYKESNVFDREINSYSVGIDALIESNRINEEIRSIESDIWNF